MQPKLEVPGLMVVFDRPFLVILTDVKPKFDFNFDEGWTDAKQRTISMQPKLELLGLMFDFDRPFFGYFDRPFFGYFDRPFLVILTDVKPKFDFNFGQG